MINVVVSGLPPRPCEKEFFEEKPIMKNEMSTATMRLVPDLKTGLKTASLQTDLPHHFLWRGIKARNNIAALRSIRNRTEV